MARPSPLDSLYSMVRDSAHAGAIHRAAEDEALDGRTVRLDGADLLNFGSCSYLGLELDPRLRDGVIDAVSRYGTQFSSSRAYLSAPLYPLLEEQLAEIFGAHVLVTPSTTLGHLSALPVLIGGDDAVLIDHQVHHSVQTACQVARRAGCSMKLIPHGNLERLEKRVAALSRNYRFVWYMADAVYSMFGDLAPMAQLVEILERHPKMRLYVDDAHGMSWRGARGCGVALSQVPLHPRMVLATSLNKSFAAAGGCLVFPDAEQQQRVRALGGPMIFSGPIQPPMLGAAVASAEIHLSGEVEKLQEDLQERVELCTRLLVEHDLPLVSGDATPIRFIGLGVPAVARNLMLSLLEEGFFANLSHYPAVPMRHAGVRIAITRHHTAQDIEVLVEAIDRHFEEAFEKEGEDPEGVFEAFDLPPRARARRGATVAPSRCGLEVYERIEDLDAQEWDACLGGRGTFTWNGLRFLERCFTRSGRPEDEWSFRYFVTRDEAGRIVLATFFTAALWKADMLASEAVSRAVEQERERLGDRYHLTDKVFSMGSLLTEGNHLYVDPERLPPGSTAWRSALTALLAAVREEAHLLDAKMVVLRDLPAPDPAADAFLRGQGFVRTEAPERFVAPVLASEAAQLAALTTRHRWFQRREVIPFNDRFVTRVLTCQSDRPDPALLRAGYALYRQVKGDSLEINTFDLPEDVLERMLEFPEWELTFFWRRAAGGGARDEPPVGVGACFVGPEQYCPMVIGLDYRYVRSEGLYRQCLRDAFTRARHHGLGSVSLGMGAGLQKRRFGAQLVRGSVYLQTDDTYSLDVLEEIASDVGAPRG